MEICSMCDGPTGRSGRLDDSLYCERDGCERGPFCEACHVTHLAECEISRLKSERDFNAASLRDANAEIARLRAEVERLTRERDANFADFARMRDHANDVARQADADKGRLLSEVERMTRDRDLAERKAAVCREDVEINARRAESAEARVAELEAELARRPRITVNERIAPPLVFDADDPLPDMTPAPLPEPKCWHCSYNGAVVVKFCMRDGCPETPKFDIGTFNPQPAPCRTCGGFARVCRCHGEPPSAACYELIECPDCRGEKKK